MYRFQPLLFAKNKSGKNEENNVSNRQRESRVLGTAVFNNNLLYSIIQAHTATAVHTTHFV